MRKGLLVIQVVVAFSAVQIGVALAGGTSDIGPGCGLGKVAWEGSRVDTNTVGAQLLISTTNNTILPWQAFGITSGTLGCKNNGKVWAQEKVNMFASANFESLSQEMAQGQGEHLASLATLMGVPADHQGVFFAMAQERYTSFVQAGEPSPVRLVQVLNDGMAGHPVLAITSIQ